VTDRGEGQDAEEDPEQTGEEPHLMEVGNIGRWRGAGVRRHRAGSEHLHLLGGLAFRHTRLEGHDGAGEAVILRDELLVGLGCDGDPFVERVVVEGRQQDLPDHHEGSCSPPSTSSTTI
jgi:hypothetical protein